MSDSHELELQAVRDVADSWRDRAKDLERREREQFADALRAFLYSDEARDVTGAFGFTPPIGDDFRERLIAAARSCPGSTR